MEYIQGEKPAGCVFCQIASAPPDQDAENLVVWRGQHVFLVFNKYPYNPGHVMVVPYEHAASLEALPVAVLTEIMLLANRATTALRAISSPEGFNLGVNIGKPAGAGIASHVHMHVVPRWEGDANFMSITGHTRVMPQTLEQSYELLRKALKG